MGRKRWRYLGALFFSQHKKKERNAATAHLIHWGSGLYVQGLPLWWFEAFSMIPAAHEMRLHHFGALFSLYNPLLCIFRFFLKDFHIKSRAWFSACLMCPVLAESWSKACRQGKPVECPGREPVAEECSIWCPCPPHMQGPCRKWSGQWPIGFRIAHTGCLVVGAKF